MVWAAPRSPSTGTARPPSSCSGPRPGLRAHTGPPVPAGRGARPRSAVPRSHLARDRDAYLVEDDYDGEFRYDRQPVGAMQSLAPDRVVYAGTASKTLAPGLRLGWLVVPRELIEEVVAAKTHADGQAGTIDQLTLARFITSGDYDRQVRRSRLVYRRRRDRLVATLRTELPGTQVVGAAAGLHALLPLPGGVTEQEVIAEAARRGLVVQGLDEYAIDVGERPPALVVGYARPPEHAFTGALARLVATLRATGVGRP